MMTYLRGLQADLVTVFSLYLDLVAGRYTALISKKTVRPCRAIPFNMGMRPAHKLIAFILAGRRECNSVFAKEAVCSGDHLISTDTNPATNRCDLINLLLSLPIEHPDRS